MKNVIQKKGMVNGKQIYINGRVGHHSDLVEVIPDYMINISKNYGVAIDVMIEAKHKERALFHLYEIYPELFLTNINNISNTSNKVM